ncbi:MAG: phosphate acyltransferase PlsX [Candidatus Eremiobacteraeota bacterium]|nr:phosphate acyltransferase PlsX [Candidatus Eremiobacteraeota bacterium]
MNSASQTRPRIAVDAMGGDNAPGEIVAGAIVAARQKYADIILVGDEARIRPLLTGMGAELITLVHAPDEVPMDQHPSQAIRNHERSSLGIAINLVRDKSADAVVSAGNSGAYLAIALIRLRTVEGIARPAIATVLPGLGGPSVMLDAGANVDCRPEWLAQFGMMGAAYARAVLKIQNPRVAILSVGEERTKGNQQTIEAARLLDAAPVNFIGNIEGKDVLINAADVIVADGFVGNVVLKVSEGLVSALGSVIKDSITQGSLLNKLGAVLMMPALNKLRNKYNYETYGGAPLLGLRGNCIVAHGRATHTAIASAIRAASDEAGADVVGKIEALVAPHLAREA